MTKIVNEEGEMNEQKESWLDVFGTVFKIHPFAFLLAFAGMTLGGYFLRSNIPFELKLLGLIISFSLSFLCLIFETYMIEKLK